MLRAIDGLEEIALSTNGHLLAELAAPLRAAGVDRLNVSLDSLDPAKFERITRGGDLPRVLAGLEAARAAQFRSIKLNTVAIRGFNDDELTAICRFAWERGLVPRFIEEMPMAAGRTYLPGTCLAAAEIRARVAELDPAASIVEDDAAGSARGAGPARYFRLTEAPGSSSTLTRRFGVISPMTEHFCATCNRLRLSSTGAVHACLGHDDAVDLRGPLRSGDLDGVRAAIRRALAGKRDGHTFQLIGLGGPRKAMVQIGG
jgi:cyclic pyranopterin phosphate synthase